MGWGEAHMPAPRTRADLTRELAHALGVTIPADVSAEDAWPKLLEYAGWCAGFCVGEDMGEPPWPDPTPTDHCPRCGSRLWSLHAEGGPGTSGATFPPHVGPPVRHCHECGHDRPA